MLPIILIHAAGGAARNFGSVARRLPDGVARPIDLPGHGRAGGEALRSVDASARHALEHAPAGPFIAGGHSMGGAVALTVATLAPERVRGLVMIATGARLMMARTYAEQARRDFEGFLADLLATGTSPLTIGSLRQVGAETVARDLEGCVSWDGVALARSVRAPALLFAGERDRTTPPALVREVAAALPLARVVVIPGAGHLLPVEHPDEVAREIEAFAREIG